jgi:hypothetical protein
LTMNYSSRGQKKSGKMEFEIAVRCREWFMRNESEDMKVKGK